MKKRNRELEELNRTLQSELSLRKEKETALLKSQQRFKELAELLPLGVWEIDQNGMFTFINKKGLEYMQRTPDDLRKGISAAETLIPEDRQRVKENMVKLFKGEKIVNVTEYTALLPDGKHLPILIYSAPIFSGQKVDGIRGITIDMTERKEAERALRESEERYRTVFEISSNAMAIAENDTIIHMVNRRFEALSGYSKEELEGKMSWRAFVSPRDLEKAIRHRDERMKDPEKGVKSFEFVFVDRFGKKARMMATLDVIPGTTRVVSNIVDISELILAEETLKRARDNLKRQNIELKKLDRMKDGLLRDVSHELKTPVAKHAMLMEILRAKIEKQGLTEDFNGILRTLESNIRRQENVIKNILTLSRLEGGGRKHDISMVQLDAIIRDVVNDYRYAIGTYGIILDMDLEKVSVRSDREMLWHVFSNLINNAIKYRKKGDSPRIEVYARKRKKEAIVRIADNGLGLSDECRKRIFDRFYQERPSAEGIGVGLTICKLLVEEFGGVLSIDSEGIGCGTVASIILPLDRDSSLL